MKVLVVTNAYPQSDRPSLGTFIKEQVESLRKEGVEADVLFVDGPRGRLNYLWGIFRLWGRLLTHRYDLIHAHYVFSGIVARAQLSCPVVLSHLGLEVFTTWQRFPSRMITPLVDGVIVKSQEQKDRLKCNRAEVIPSGIDLDLFRPMDKNEARKQLGLPQDRRLVLFAGEPRPEKRLDIAQAAVALARQTDPLVDLVQLSGQPHDRVPVYMNACDALLLVSDAEGSPNVVKEAMACNLPVVSVPAGDVPDVIGTTDGCYLCRQDPTDAAAKLHLVLSQGKRTNGREKVGHLEMSVIARRILGVYGKVVSDGKHS
jgi:teichuronic acid biosynthesis glycosyltransferase TuaC